MVIGMTSIHLLVVCYGFQFVETEMLLFLCLLAWISTSTSLIASHQFVEQRLVEASRFGSLIFIDGDNVRGKTSFSLSKQRLCQHVLAYAKQLNESMDFIVMFDHGEVASCCSYANESLLVAFSGQQLHL